VLHRPVELAQYTSLRFTEHLALEGIASSIGTVGDTYDNGLMESIIGLFKPECIGTAVFPSRPYRTLADIEYATTGWVDWYNRRVESGAGPVGLQPGGPRCSTGSLLVQLPLLALRVACVPSSAVTR